LQLLFVFVHSGCSGLQASADPNFGFHKRTTGTCRGESVIAACQEVDLPRPNHRFGSRLFESVVTSLWMSGGALPCLEETFGLSSSSWGVNCNTDFSLQIIPLNVHYEFYLYIFLRIRISSSFVQGKKCGTY
jgi:hypothetical protein